jgi:hypothetical protein
MGKELPLSVSSFYLTSSEPLDLINATVNCSAGKAKTNRSWMTLPRMGKTVRFLYVARSRKDNNLSYGSIGDR